MSTMKNLLTFTLRNELFAIDATAVKEIVWLPELTPAEEMPDCVAGIFNLRGHIVPVMDLNLRLGHKPERYQVTDRVIIIEKVGATTPAPPYQGGDQGEVIVESGLSPLEYGIIVNDVRDVISIPESDIEQLLAVSYQPSTHLIKGEVNVGEKIIMLLDHKAILESRIQEPGVRMQRPESKILDSEFCILNSKYSAEELTIFHARALTLMLPPEYAVSGMLPFAVVSLSGEYFGVDLEVVKEFADVRGITPVPCTPAHIVGDMNLRGEIMTLVDICGMLNIAAKAKRSKAVISQVNDLVAGIIVDDVIEVINVSPNDVRPVPASAKATGNDYIKGEFPYQGKMLSILDMSKMLASKEIVIDENK